MKELDGVKSLLTDMSTGFQYQNYRKVNYSSLETVRVFSGTVVLSEYQPRNVLPIRTA